MPPEIRKTSNFLRIKTYRGKNGFVNFRYHDIGSKGHTQRIAAQRKNGSWVTYGWIFRIVDIKNKRPKTMNILKRLKITTNKLKKIRL